MAEHRLPGKLLPGKRTTVWKRFHAHWRELFFISFSLIFVLGTLAFCFIDKETFFVARVHTTSVQFTTATAEAGEDGTGLFAPSRGPLDIAVHGCAELAPMSEQANASLRCKGRSLDMGAVRLSSLVLAPQTLVTLTTFDGGVRVQLKLPASQSSFHCVVSTGPESRLYSVGSGPPEGAHLSLPRGDWLLRPGQDVIVLSMVESGGVKALPDEQSIGLSEQSDLYLEQRDESSLIGTENVLEIPLADERKINLDANRLQLEKLHDGSIQHLQWTRAASGPSSMSLVVSGKSRVIKVSGDYSDEAANYALSEFDTFHNGARTQSLIAAVTLLTVLPNIAASLVTIAQYRKDAHKVLSGPQPWGRQPPGRGSDQT